MSPSSLRSLVQPFRSMSRSLLTLPRRPKRRPLFLWRHLTCCSVAEEAGSNQWRSLQCRPPLHGLSSYGWRSEDGNREVRQLARNSKSAMHSGQSIKWRCVCGLTPRRQHPHPDSLKLRSQRVLILDRRVAVLTVPSRCRGSLRQGEDGLRRPRPRRLSC